MKDYRLINSVFISNIFGAGSKRALKVLFELNENLLIDKNFSDLADNSGFIKIFGDRFNKDDYNKSVEIVNYCKNSGISIMSYFDDSFPESLRNINDSPIVLYAIGQIPDFNKMPSITIVGPRIPSEMGLKYSRILSYRFSRSGMLVVSGGGIGCETEICKGSLGQKGKTVVILPCGIDFNYINRNLSKGITDNGCIMSEYPPEFPTLKYNYPMRNRIMAGISLMTVVVEAKEKSGALISAKKALSYNKDVYVIPGNPAQKEYKGSNLLLLNGAKPLIDINLIFNEYLRLYPGVIDTKKAFERADKDNFKKNNTKIIKISKETLSNEAKMLYNYIDKPVFSIDDFSSLELTTDEILSAVTELELEGLIIPSAGGKYKLK